jgi:hypothetical protein
LSSSSSFLLPFFFFFCGTEDWTHGLTYVRQTLLPPNYIFNLVFLFFNFFWSFETGLL